MSETILISNMATIDGDMCSSQTLPQPNGQGVEPMERKKRTRTGCLNCSRRRRKCDEAKPTCTGCKRRGDDCQWRLLGAFREANIKVLDSGHPSMSQGVTASQQKRPSRFKILNALSNSPRTRGSSKRQSEVTSLRLRPEREPEPLGSPPGAFPSFGVDPEPRSKNPSPSVFGHSVASPEVEQGPPTPSSREVPSHLVRSQHPTSPRPRLSQEISEDLHSHGTTSPHHSTHESDIQRNPIADDGTSHAFANASPQFPVDELAALRGYTHHAHFDASLTGSYPNGPSPLFENSIFSDPADFNDIFVPGSTYEALHTTLRNRQIWTARPEGPSRASSRSSFSYAHSPRGYRDSSLITRTDRDPRTGRFFRLSPEREHILWQNYLNEICSWVRFLR